MSVKYHVIIRNGEEEFRATRTGACFGLLASGNSDDRHGSFHITQADGTGPHLSQTPHWTVQALNRCEFDEIVYEVYEVLSRGYIRVMGQNVETRMLGGVSFTLPIVKTRLRAFLSDLLDIQKELPWLGIVSVDLQNMWVKVDTRHPSDQVFQCLSSIRNIITYDYDGYCDLRKQGFSKKAAFLLAQNFRKYKNAMGDPYWKPTPICDYMMVNHAFMRPIDILRLYNGRIPFKLWTFKGSRGYHKPSNYHISDEQWFNTEQVRNLQNFYNNGRFTFCENWSTFLSTHNPEEGFVMGRELRSAYLGESDSTILKDHAIELMNRWVHIINRG